LLLGEAGSVEAQVFTTLHSFTGSNDGYYPSGLVLSGNTLYGTAAVGGSGGNGTVFKVNTDGSGFSMLHSFTGSNTNSFGILTNYDGANPSGSLVLSNNTLYGTAQAGGTSGNGTVFKLNIDGTDFTNLYSFSASTTNSSGSYTNSDGAKPGAGLGLLSNTLYGTAQGGGISGNGTVFKLNTDGTGLAILHNFTALIPDYRYTNYGGYAAGTNSDGAEPSDLIVLSGNTTYGTARSGGSSASGTVFAVNTDGTGFKTLLEDGSVRLIVSGNSLYGTQAIRWGNDVHASVFRCNIDGTDFTELYAHTFGLGGNSAYGQSESFSWGGLVLSGNTLYYTLWHEDPTGILGHSPPTTESLLLGIKVDGSVPQLLYGCCGECGFGLGGPGPGLFFPCVGLMTGLALSGDMLYGIGGGDTIFRVSFAPQLTITPSAANMILSWPTNYAGFDYTGYTLQSTTNISSPVWTTNLTAPVVVNGLNTVTNPISGTQRFFRLVQ
jgi:uncharacterized repeat protein (TIGR03803 family)